mgnify:CR=1 FL=1
MRVLMFGWEFPPHISGGLGTACYGMTRGMCRQGTEVLFVLPRLKGDSQGMDAHLNLCPASGTVVTDEVARAVTDASHDLWESQIKVRHLAFLLMAYDPVESYADRYTKLWGMIFHYSYWHESSS